MNLTELEQLAAMDELGSFSEVARRFFVSTPTVTRNMARVEKYYGVELFSRGKNRVDLTEAGRLAAVGAQRILRELEASVAEVRAYDRNLRTIDVVSCAPAPLWVLTPRVSRLYPHMGMTSRVASLAQTEEALVAGSCDVAVLPRPAGEASSCAKLMDEHLFLCVPPDHALAKRKSVTLAEINGFNFLLGSDLGFWNDVVRRRLPASRFLVQGDEFALSELIRTSSLPCFTTDVALESRYRDADEGRVSVPIEDAEVNVTFYLVATERGAKKAACLFA
ncbi:MAG: LysR family transcriptional regulator [Eggerthellaceae bacterium]|nr:LysR family transcriptional regulator [Eggerthellaceae bacterium]